MASKISETSLYDYVIHPITVTSISLSGLKDEQREEMFFFFGFILFELMCFLYI